jgi:hypothetical protein
VLKSIGVTWLITLVGGGGGGEAQNQPWVLGVKLERGEDWFETLIKIHTTFFPILTPNFYLSLLNSVVKKILR